MHRLGGLGMRAFRSFAIICLAVTQAGCADILPWPGFESHPGVFSYTEQIPASEVAEQVRCELAEFIRDEERRLDNNKSELARFLDPNRGAQVQLKLTTDVQGSVSYLGVNLKTLGLTSLASLVTTNNNAPSLQLKAQGKSTQTSQVDFILPQTTSDFIYSSPPSALPGVKPPKWQKLPLGLRLPTLQECSRGGPAKQLLQYTWFRLWLSAALQRYKDRLGEEGYGGISTAFVDRVCQPKLTVTTQFQLLFDISAGTNILQLVPIILPISGANVDVSPDYTHYLQIIFSLRPHGKFEADGVTPFHGDKDTQARIDACQALQGTNPPSSFH